MPNTYAAPETSLESGYPSGQLAPRDSIDQFYLRRMVDEFTARYGDLLTGCYDCVDRVVLNAYFSMGTPGGFRVWWRRCTTTATTSWTTPI